MVSIQKGKQSSLKVLRNRKAKAPFKMNRETLGFMAAALFLGFCITSLFSVPFLENSLTISTETSSRPLRRQTKKHPILMEESSVGLQQPQPMHDGMNAIALDILDSLDCPKLLEQAEKDISSNGSIYYGGGGADDFMLKQDADMNTNATDDIVNPYGGGYVDLNAKHLFCLAASEAPPESVVKEIQCDASKTKRRSLLELWSSARPHLPQDLLTNVLDLARENEKYIFGQSYNLWSPVLDNGLQYMSSTFNEDTDVDNGGLNGLEGVLGPDKLFVDVGSWLGLTSLVINNKYPGTTILAIEPASPNWFLQEVNFRCNLEDRSNIDVVLAGVGADEDSMAKFMWRPSATASTRSWTPASEFQPEQDVELVVQLRNFQSILAEAKLDQSNINVLNLDCQGCEYNMIPSLTNEEFSEIPTVMGRIHWGYIQESKLPSSKRGKVTHERLCEHENVARETKECCAFPDLAVKSSIPGQIFHANDSKEYPLRASTVSDVIADDLCADFPAWADEHYLNAIEEDFNWFELSSQA